MSFSDLLWGDCLLPRHTPLTVNDDAHSHSRTISMRYGTLSCYGCPGPPLWPCLNLQTIFSFKSFLPTSFHCPHSEVTPALRSHSNPNSFSIFLHLISFNTSPRWGVTSFRKTQTNSVPTKMSTAGRWRLSSNQSAWYSSPRSTQHFKGFLFPMVFISFLPFTNSPGLGSFEISFSSTLGNLTHFSWEIKSKLETGEPAQRKGQKMIAYT